MKFASILYSPINKISYSPKGYNILATILVFASLIFSLSTILNLPSANLALKMVFKAIIFFLLGILNPRSLGWGPKHFPPLYLPGARLFPYLDLPVPF